MHKFVRNLITEWRKQNLPFANETILIAVSGGADSVALMLALYDLREAKKLNLNLLIAHFNHKLRETDADADEKFVKELAQKLDFRFLCESWKSKDYNSRENIEQSARKARYEFLLKAAEKENAFAVLTAHTVNDQAETLLLNLLRGSGLEGLGAMKIIRRLRINNHNLRKEKSDVLLIRPLLNWAKREETEGFVNDRKLNFRLDSMNADEKFSRVKIRKKLIPFLREFNPKIVETLAQTAFLLQEDFKQKSEGRDQKSENPSVKELQNLSQSELYIELRTWLKTMRGNLRQIGLQNVRAIERLIFSRKSGRKVELPGGSAVIKKEGRLFFEKTKVEKSRSDN